MKRRTLDFVFSIGGGVMAILLLILGLVLQNQASFAKAYGQLDASISYDITPNISVSVEGLNLLNEPELRYQEIEERLLSYRVNDRRVLFGIRIKN